MYKGNLLAKIHIGKKQMGCDDGDYRAFLCKHSANDMSDSQRLRVTRLGDSKPLTGVQKAFVAKCYKVHHLGEVNSKDKASLNRYIKKQFGKWNVADLTIEETNKLAGMLENWIKKTEHTGGYDEQIIKQRL